MIKPIQQKLFCQQYWERVLRESGRTSRYASVSDHDLLYNVNCTLLRAQKNKPLSTSCATRTIINADKEFKLIEPTKEKLTLWRGVTMPRFNDPHYKAFSHSFNVKPGDIVHMPEYAFAAEKASIALSYARPGKRGILYEIEVPKGARISNSFNYVFPRYSRFECLEVERIPSQNYDIKNIKLRYILPEIFNGEESIFKKASDMFQGLFS